MCAQIDVIFGVNMYKHRVFRNVGAGQYSEITAGDLTNETQSQYQDRSVHSLAVGDLNADGALDLVIARGMDFSSNARGYVRTNQLFQGRGGGEIHFSEVTSSAFTTATSDTRSCTLGDCALLIPTAPPLEPATLRP